MSFKFEKLEVWQLSLKYLDLIYDLSVKLPDSEKFNLKSQITRAATSISLNIAEGSTGQSDLEQNRFLGMALRSLLETVACVRIIEQRKYVSDVAFLTEIDTKAQELAKRISAFRNALTPPRQKSISEETAIYDTELF